MPVINSDNIKLNKMKKILSIFVVLLTTATGLAQQQVTIGNQEWKSHNLSVTAYRNGNIIPQVADPVQWASLTTGAWCYINNDPATNAVYGKLYNWYAVHDPRGLAPIGWHIPTTTEWTVLTTYLGGNTIAGGKLKTTGTSLWNSPNVITSPNSFFNAVPAGFRYGTSSTTAFRQPGVSAYFWTNNSSSNSGYAYATYILNLQADIISTVVEKRRGCTVRCIADPRPPNTPK
jgi:uncharacterized protein (TIGR02145 family)